jgi:hypothetical protein
VEVTHCHVWATHLPLYAVLAIQRHILSYNTMTHLLSMLGSFVLTEVLRFHGSTAAPCIDCDVTVPECRHQQPTDVEESKSASHSPQMAGTSISYGLESIGTSND